MSLSFSGAIDYVSQLLRSLDLRENPDGFDFGNVPAYKMDRSFFIEIGQIQGQAANQIVHEFTLPLTLNVFFSDYKNQNQLRVMALDKLHDIYRLLLSPNVRLSNQVKDVRPRSVTINPVTKSNEGIAVLAVNLDIILMFHFTD